LVTVQESHLPRQTRRRVLALVPYPLNTAPGQRYRIEQWAPYLSECGIDVLFLPFASEALGRALYRRGAHVAKGLQIMRGIVARFSHVWGAARYDAVFLYREASLIGPAWLERLAQARRPQLLYDFDDAIWVPYVSPSNRYLSLLKAPWKTATICRLAAAVIVGSEYLATYARRFSSRVTVIPSTVSLRRYRPRPGPRRPGPPVVGWTGSHSSLQYLREVEQPLKTLAGRLRFRFVAIGVEGFQIPGVQTECRPWRSASEVEDLWDLDVGIMPLPDGPWTRGKCAMKAIQYMGVGIPALVSPVGANVDVVTHGKNGFLVGGPDEWVELLDRVLRDSDLRERLGREARRTVEARFSAEVHAPRVAEVVRSMLT
jgi:glycosyltransferase involved in cell wall biosynthesis